MPDLPDELWDEVLDWLDFKEVASYACVSTTFWQTAVLHWHSPSRGTENCKGGVCDCQLRKYESMDRATPLACIECGGVLSHAKAHYLQMCGHCVDETIDSLVCISPLDCAVL